MPSGQTIVKQKILLQDPGFRETAWAVIMTRVNMIRHFMLLMFGRQLRDHERLSVYLMMTHKI